MQRVLTLRLVTKYWVDAKRKKRAMTKYPNIFAITIVPPEDILWFYEHNSFR